MINANLYMPSPTNENLYLQFFYIFLPAQGRICINLNRKVINGLRLPLFRVLKAAVFEVQLAKTHRESPQSSASIRM